MNAALLDHINQAGALHDIARCGGLIAAQQLHRFMGCTPTTARKAYRNLERARMAHLIRPNRNVIFLLLTKATVEALGEHLPIPPQRSKLRMTSVEYGIARAEFFLKFNAVPWRTTDLVGRWGRGQTKARVHRAASHHVVAWRQEALRLREDFQAAPTEEKKVRYEALRRRLRDPQVITQAGMAALANKRGLHVLDPAGPLLHFCFVDRVSTRTTLTGLKQMLSRFAAGTSMHTRLDILCGAERAKRRLSRLLGQESLRVEIRLVNLEYHRFIGMTTALGPLVTEPLPKALNAEAGR